MTWSLREERGEGGGFPRSPFQEGEKEKNNTLWSPIWERGKEDGPSADFFARTHEKGHAIFEDDGRQKLIDVNYSDEKKGKLRSFFRNRKGEGKREKIDIERRTKKTSLIRSQPASGRGKEGENLRLAAYA